MKLKVKQRNWLLSLHIAAGGLWFGTALCSVALALGFRSLNDGEGLYGINIARNLLGELVIIPAAILSILTGALLCAFTNWGFFKHFWVMAKQLVTLLLMVIGSVWLGPWTKEMTTISQAMRLALPNSQGLPSWQNSHYLSLQNAVILGGALQTLALLLIIAISTIKPWGKRQASRTTR